MNVKIDFMVWSLRSASVARRLCECSESTRLLRKSIIKTLDATDFSKYFDDTTQWGCDLWAFGKDINGEEIYIKIGLGLPNRQTVCVSFHKADFPIQYPFK